jgi:hypothetical protein
MKNIKNFSTGCKKSYKYMVLFALLTCVSGEERTGFNMRMIITSFASPFLCNIQMATAET